MCVRVRARARARVCVCVCVCVFLIPRFCIVASEGKGGLKEVGGGGGGEPVNSLLMIYPL